MPETTSHTYNDDEMLQLSGIQHYVFCPRQWALIYIEQAWIENHLTAEGRVMHENVDTTTQEGRTRLRKEAKYCVNHGQRVQNSVFECSLTMADLIIFKSQLLKMIDCSIDTVRIYRLGKDYHSKIELLGKETSFDIEGDLII